MSGLCPPVPTELVSVFYLKTGSVQQEQEWSSLTGTIHVPCCHANFPRTCSKTARPRFSISFAVLSCVVDHTHHRALASSHWPWWKPNPSPPACQTTALNPEVYAEGGAAPVRRLSLSLLKYECFMSRFTILCLIGRPRRPEPLCEYCYILMQSILLFCSAFMFISAFFPLKNLQTRLSLFAYVSPSLWLALFFLSFCAVKGQTETGVHCQVIPVKCLLCLCNWCHPVVPIISDWECCFLPFSPFNSQPPKEKCFISRSSYPLENGSSLASMMNLLLSSNFSDP